MLPLSQKDSTIEIIESSLKGVKLFRPVIHTDNRGYLLETFRVGEVFDSFVQDNLSFSTKNCLRGMHFQQGLQQDKLVFVVTGKIFDVVVDIRKDSSTFGMWEGYILDDKEHHQLFIPKGFAHGFCVLSDRAYVMYKISKFYVAQLEKGFHWKDPDVDIRWPIDDPIVSDKDKNSPPLRELLL